MKCKFLFSRGRVNNAVSLYLCIFAFILVLLLLAHAFVVSESDIEVLFSPRDDCAAQILSYLDGAEGSIDVAMYYFTDRILAQALVRAKERGVSVRVYLDESQRSEKYPKGRYLERKGISVRYEDGVGLMHDKFCIVDGKMVITGSFNWTTSADLKNDENLLIIRSVELAKKFTDQFEKFWDGSYVDECKYTDESRLKKVEK